MTDQKAIAIFTGLKMMVGTEAKEACDIAISALQERDERSKPIMEWQSIATMSGFARIADMTNTVTLLTAVFSLRFVRIAVDR